MSENKITIEANPYKEKINYYYGENKTEIESSLHGQIYVNTTIEKSVLKILDQIQKIYGKNGSAISIDFMGTETDYKNIDSLLKGEKYQDAGINVNLIRSINGPKAFRNELEKIINEIDNEEIIQGIDNCAKEISSSKSGNYEENVEYCNESFKEEYESLREDEEWIKIRLKALELLKEKYEDAKTDIDVRVPVSEIKEKITGIKQEILNNFDEKCDKRSSAFGSDMKAVIGEYNRRGIKDNYEEKVALNQKGKTKKISKSDQAKEAKKEVEELWKKKCEEFFLIESEIKESEKEYVERIRDYFTNYVRDSVVFDSYSDIFPVFLPKEKKKLEEALGGLGDPEKKLEEFLKLYQGKIPTIKEELRDRIKKQEARINERIREIEKGNVTAIQMEKDKKKNEIKDRIYRLQSVIDKANRLMRE